MAIDIGSSGKRGVGEIIEMFAGEQYGTAPFIRCLDL